MTQVRRLGAAGAGLALAAVLTCAHVWGGPDKDDAGKKTRAGARPDRQPDVEDVASTKFSDQPLISYHTRDQETVFGWQLKPKLDAVRARPRDVLVLVDTTSSQAGAPLATANKLAEAICN